MGLRQFERVAAVDSPRALRLLRHLSQILIKRFGLFVAIHGIVATAISLLTGLFLRPAYSPLHDAIYETFLETAAHQPSSACFCDALAWLPSAIRSGRNVEAVVARLNLFMRIHSPHIFALAAAVLTEQIRAAKAERKDALAIEAYFTFLSEHSENQGYYTAYYLRGFADVFEGLGRNTLFHFCANSAKAVRFLPFFCCVAAVVQKVGDHEWTHELVKALLTMVDSPAHRRALECIRDGPLAREAIDAACSA
jgi:hypothetical protein